MALYHFTVKNNKKPSGDKVKAVDHVNYISREGKYSDYDNKDKTIAENLIYTDFQKDILDGKTHILYSSPFGDIYNTERGISVTNEPSLETIATSLMLANQTMKGPLIIQGTDEFKAKCVISAVQSNLPIRFKDNSLQELFEKKKEELQNEQEQSRNEDGVTYRRNGSISKPDSKRSSTKLSQAPTLKTIPNVCKLPVGKLGMGATDTTAMLLQEYESGFMGQYKSDKDAIVRWGLRETGGRRRIVRDFYAERTERAKRTARAIIDNIDEVKKRTKAESHVEYINRQKAFEKRGGCIYTKCRLPKWAVETQIDEETGKKKKVPSANVFFRAADKYSAQNDRTYKEIEFALQNELTLEQNLEIVDRFIAENLNDHYYTYAIHDKIGTLSDNTRHLHVHIMFSPRTIDEVEKIKERNKSSFFSYPLRFNAKDQSFENKWKHGAHKDRKWDYPSNIVKARANFANITNEVLEKYGWSVRVDHRSLKTQLLDAKASGDEYLVQLLERVPESYISQNKMLEEKNPEVANLLSYRKDKKIHRDLLFKAERIEKMMDEEERYEIYQKIKEDIQKIIESNEYKDSDTDSDSFIGELRTTFLESYQDYQKIRSQIISMDEVLDMFKMEYMDDEECDDYLALKQINEDIRHWQEFQQTMAESEFTDADGDADGFDAFNKLGPALEDKLAKMEETRIKLQKRVNEIESKLENESIKKAIQQNTHKFMYEQKHQENLLKKAENNLKTTIITLSQALFNDVEEVEVDRMYSFKDVYDSVRKDYYGYKKRVNKLTKEVADARKKVISPERAEKMAENIYVKGAFKKLREDERALKKEENRYLKMQEDLQKREKDLLNSKDMPGVPQQEIRDKERFIETLRNDIKELRIELDNKTEELANTRKELTERISTPDAISKIHDIALGILRKNKPDNQRYQFLKNSLNDARRILAEKSKEIGVLTKAMKIDKENKRRFKIDRNKTPVNISPKEEPGIIASAIAGNDYHMNIVTTIPKEDDKGLDSWMYLSDAAKEDIIFEQILAEIL